MASSSDFAEMTAAFHKLQSFARLVEAENAIKFDPNNESAWSYKTNLLLEASKLAEMDDMNGDGVVDNGYWNGLANSDPNVR